MHNSLSREKTVLFTVFSSIVALNLSWAHQTILTQMVNIKDYYDLTIHPPFIYRILPALLYRLVTLGKGELLLGLNAPFGSSYEVFQIVLDTISLIMTLFFMIKISHFFNPLLPKRIIYLFASAAWLMIIVFGFFMVPNAALFYPYDFLDLFFAALIYYLCIQGRSDFILPLAIFLGTMNKETTGFYLMLYVIFYLNNTQNWKLATIVVLISVAAFFMSRSLVLLIVSSLSSNPITLENQYQFQGLYTLQQLKNPLLFFAIFNICSYFYMPIFWLRKRFDRTDTLILCMVAVWVLIMTSVGIIRELRLFAPASLLLFVILARHLEYSRAYVLKDA